MAGVLAIDPGSKITGWAFAEPGAARPEWGQFVMRCGDETAKNDAGAIGARFEIFLEARLDVFRPDYIVREQPYIPPAANFDTIFALVGLAWQIDTIAERKGIECRQATTLAAVKYFTGQAKFPGANLEQRRKAKKRATVAMCKMHGWECGEDAADALALLCYAEAKLFPRRRQLKPTGPLFALDKGADSGRTRPPT